MRKIQNCEGSGMKIKVEIEINPTGWGTEFWSETDKANELANLSHDIKSSLRAYAGIELSSITMIKCEIITEENNGK